MRTFETILVLLLFAAWSAIYLPPFRRRRWVRFLPAALVVLALVQLVVEGYRWQMVPSYALTAALFLITLPNLAQGTVPSRSGKRALAGGAAVILIWLIAAALPVVLPVLNLPMPPGPYAVGSVTYDWTDPARGEIYSPDPDDRREVVVQVWYPAEPGAEAELVPYVDSFDIAIPAFADFLGLPPFILGHLRLVKTNSYQDLPVRHDGAPYPLVIYSHGYTSNRTASFSQMEALASSGYIAVAIDHPYAASFTIFSDGRVVLNDPGVLPAAGQNQTGDQEMRERLASVAAEDQRFVMDQLQRLNDGELDPRFAGLLDMQRIGLTGVSYGGGAVVWTCQLDSRCRAGLVQDGWYEPLPEAIVTKPLRAPFMFMQSETQIWKLDNIPRLERLYQLAEAPAYHLKFSGVLHADFGDYPLLTPVSGVLYERGSLNGPRTLQVVNTYILAFFDRYLKSQTPVLLDGPSPDFPEVGFESRNP